MAWKKTILNGTQMIGNDVVDLGDPANQNKHKDSRFLVKVCSEEEQRLLKLEKNSHSLLWTFWAIKEASYKALKKQFDGVRFIPPQYKCTKISEDEWEC